MAGGRRVACASSLVLSLCAGFVEAQQALYPLDVAALMCERNDVTGEFVFRTTQQEIQLDVNIPTQSAAKAKIHVPSIFRTSGKEVALRLSMKDAAGVDIVREGGYYRLSAVAGRRLTSEHEAFGDTSSEGADSGAAAQCEDVFLLDGRSPVDLPDTWAEAREAFRSVCELELGLDNETCGSEELNLFQGYPSDSTDFSPEGKLCSSLEGSISKHNSGAIALKARRLKSGGGVGAYSTAGGAPAAGAWTNPSRTSVPDYGYSTSRLSTTYPRGYTTTRLGYAGRTSSFPRGTTSTRAAVLAGATFGWLGPWRFRSYARTSTGDSADVGDCEDPSAPCEWNLDVQDLVREDLMSFGFYPNQMTYPLKLTVTAIEGDAVNNISRVCPPAGWNGSSQVVWEQGDDIFFSLVEVAVLEENEADAGMIVGIVFGVLAGLTLVGLCMNRRRIQLLMKLNSMQKERRYLSPTSTVRDALGPKVTLKCSLMGQSGTPIEAVYNLRITPTGHIFGTGSIPQENQQPCQVSGAARGATSDNPSEINIHFQGHWGPGTSEVSLTLFDHGVWEGDGDYVSKKPGPPIFPLAFKMAECTVNNAKVAPVVEPGPAASAATVCPVVMGQPVQSNDVPKVVGEGFE